MTLSTYSANKVALSLLADTAYTPGASLWIALFTSSAGLLTNAPENEIATADYARLEILGATGRTMTVGADGVSANDAAWEFPPVLVNSQGIVTYVALMDSLLSGNVIAFGPLATAVSLVTGQILRFPTGAFVVTPA